MRVLGTPAVRTCMHIPLHQAQASALLSCALPHFLSFLSSLQGMRQDCTVQHIRNELAARVYEAHARAALEYGDVAEYNQCQSQVAVLYQGESNT